MKSLLSALNIHYAEVKPKKPIKPGVRKKCPGCGKEADSAWKNGRMICCRCFKTMKPVKQKPPRE